MKGTLWLSAVLCAGAISWASAQEQPASRGLELTGGMGVNAIDIPDVVEWINNTTTGSENLQSFTSAVEFFGAGGLAIAPDWRLKLEYGYILTSYNRSAQLGPAEFFVWMHLPSVVLEYILADRGLYVLKAGLGAGYHFGGVEQRYSFLDTRYTAGGVGFVGELEGNTALSEHLYAYLAVTVRWDALGELRDANGTTAGGSTYAPAPTMQMFAFGARLGLSYYF